MISPVELQAYIAVLRAGGVAIFEHDGLKLILGPRPPAPGEGTTTTPKTSDYNSMLFAATEGIPEEEEGN